MNYETSLTLTRAISPVEGRIGQTALHLASAHGDVDLLKVLLEAGEVEVDSLDRRGNTPLHYCGHVDTAKLLLDSGANPLIRNHRLDAPLDLMKRKGLPTEVLHLVENAVKQRYGSTGDRKPLLTDFTGPPGQGRSQHHLEERGSSPADIFREFCTDLGAKRFALILVILVCLSLYTAYVITRIAGGYERHVLVDSDYAVDGDSSESREL